MHRLINTKIKSRNAILGVFLVMIGLFFVLGVKTAYAATFSFVDGNYSTETNGYISATRFHFVNPYLIQDTLLTASDPVTAGTNSALNNNVVYSTTATNNIFDESGFYWYWPSGNSLGIKNGACVAALVLSVDNNKHGVLNMVQPKVGGSGGNCIIQGVGGKALDSSSVTGKQPYMAAGGPTGVHGGSGSAVNPDIAYAIKNTGIVIGTSKYELLNGATFFHWVNPTEIDSYPGNVQLTPLDQGSPAQTYILARINSKYSNSSFFTNSACLNKDGVSYQAFLAVSSSDPTTATVFQSDGTATGTYSAEWIGTNVQCLLGGTNFSPPPMVAYGGSTNPAVIGLADVPNSSGANQMPTGTGGVAGASGSQSNALDCQAGYNPLNWLICGIVNGMVSVTNQLDNLIISQLSVGTNSNSTNPALIFGNKTTGDNASSSAYYKAWSNFRNIALALMVVAGLVAIISQALGFELLDAYTIRKVLPRFIAVAIFITLSWQIMDFLITLTNAIGYGIASLIYAPFSGMSTHINLSMGGGLAITLLSATAITALGIIGLLSFAVTAALAVFVAYLTLVIRQILIVALIIVAPIAIVCYVLPNTQRVYKIWWESFFKALLMFPIIMAIIAAGHSFALVAAQQDTAISQFIAFTAYFAPYFLIPATFKFAGGAMARLGGVVNDRGRGGFDRLKNFRGNQVKRNAQAIRNGKRWQGNPVAERASRSLQTASLLGNAGFNPARMRSRVQSARSTRISELSAEAEKSSAVRSVLGNDDLLQASVAGNGTEADARSYLQRLGQSGQLLEQNVASIRQARRDMGREAFQDFAAANIAGTGTGYASGPAEMFETINRVAGGDRARATRILNSARGQAERARRTDLSGAGFGTSAEQLQQLYEGHTTADAVNEVMTDEVITAKSAYEVAGGRRQSVANLSGAVTRRVARAQDDVDTARASGDADRIAIAEHEQKRVLAATAGLLEVAGSVSTENAQIIGAVMGQAAGGTVNEAPVYSDVAITGPTGAPIIDTATGAPLTRRVQTGATTRPRTVGDQINELRTDDEFAQYRREMNYGAPGDPSTARGMPPGTIPGGPVPPPPTP